MMSEDSQAASDLQSQIEESLDASRWEGVAAQIPTTILDFYLVPLALFLGAPSEKMGFLVALPSFLSALSQFFVVDILHAAGNRRRLLVGSVVLQTLSLAPLPFLVLVHFHGAVAELFALVSVFRVIGAVMGPPWGSLMSDYLPETRRGDYFGKRSELIGICGIVCAAMCGIMLHLLQRISRPTAFCLLLACACTARAVSLRFMRRMVNLPEHAHPKIPFDFASLLERLRQSNFARFVLYVAGITFATQVTAAYFSVHMLRDLHYDFIPYTAVQLASAMMAFGAYPIWGRHADIIGNARVIKVNSFLLPLVPILWCLTERAWILVFIEGFSGFLWAGFNLCCTNFIFDAVEPSQRVKALGYYNLISGVAIFAGGSFGSYLAEHMPGVLGYQLHGLFLAGAALRFIADFALARKFEEARPAGSAPGSMELFFSVVGIHPFPGLTHEIDWDPPARLGRRKGPDS